MARLSIVLTRFLSVAGSAVAKATTSPSPHSTDCAHIEAPTSLTWLLQDQPFEQKDPSLFFYVNQDIDATGNKANRVAQLVTFGPSLEVEPTECKLLFAMPENTESWELIQREGAGEMRVFQVPTGTAEVDAIRRKRNVLGAIKVKPGIQTVDLTGCDGGSSFVFELTGEGRSRVAFRQALKPGDGFGVFMGSSCEVPKMEAAEDL